MTISNKRYNKERRKAKHLKNRLKDNERSRIYYYSHKQEIDKYNESRREEKRVYASKYYYENHEKVLKKSSIYSYIHREEHKKYRQNIRLKLMNILEGDYCKHCGFNDIRALQFDHINGGGKEDRKDKGGTYSMMEYYIKHPEEAKQKLQVLCANCNIEKKEKNKMHNHYDQFKNILNIRIKLMNILGGVKCICGQDQYNVLHFDHIKAGGRKDVEIKVGVNSMIRYYLKNPEEAKKTLQVLCVNCNTIKKIVNKEYNSKRIFNPTKISSYTSY